MVSDTAKVIMRNILPPYNIIDSSVSVLDQNGNAVFNFNNVFNDISYYIDFRHRNSIETRAKATSLFNYMSYDFSSSASMAYGSNLMKLIILQYLRHTTVMLIRTV